MTLSMPNQSPTQTEYLKATLVRREPIESPTKALLIACTPCVCKRNLLRNEPKVVEVEEYSLDRRQIQIGSYANDVVATGSVDNLINNLTMPRITMLTNI